MTLYTPPLTPQFAAGYAPGPNDFGAWVQQTLGFQVQGIGFRAEQTITQAIGTSATTVSYDTVLEDPWSGWVSATNRWVAPESGWYEITAFVSCATTSTILTPSVLITGSSGYTVDVATQSSAVLGGGTCFARVPMVGGADYVQIQASGSSGFSTDVSSAGRFSTLEATFVSQ